MCFHSKRTKVGHLLSYHKRILINCPFQFNSTFHTESMAITQVSLFSLYHLYDIIKREQYLFNYMLDLV